jgi:hypothetical protein
MHRLISRALGFTGVLLLLLAVVRPWFEVPAGFIDTPGGPPRCRTSKPWATRPYQLTCLGSAGFVAWHAVRRQTSDRGAICTALLLAALLFFPYSIMVWDPVIAARAAWLQMQHENLIWLGGDLFTNLEYSRVSWKDHVDMVDTPRQVCLFKVPTFGPESIQLGMLGVWVESLGYSNRFCQFMRPGWVAAMLGACATLMSECLPDGRLRRRRLLRAGWASTGAVVAGCLLSLVPLTAASFEIWRAREATFRGRPGAAVRHLRRAATALPALREDTYYVAQLGLLQWRMGWSHLPEARLFAANIVERQGMYDQALEVDRDLVVHMPPDSAVHREASRALLRAGIYALNGGRLDRATELLEAVLHDEPCSLKANYALQLAYLRSSRHRDLVRLVDRIVATYQYFQFPTKSVVMSSSNDNLFLDAVRNGDMGTALHRASKVRNP